MRLPRYFNQETLSTAVATSMSMRQVIDKLYPQYSAGIIPTVKKYIKLWKLDTSHWTGQAWARGTSLPSKQLAAHDLTSGHSRNTVKRVVLRTVPYVCAVCNLSEWLGRPLVLQLDHINGINDDNRIENLRLLCPNCHSQTETYGGKNKVSIVGLEPTQPAF